jgi:hypothetical protein
MVQATLQRSYGIMNGHIEIFSQRKQAEEQRVRAFITAQQQQLAEDGGAEWVEAYDSAKGGYYCSNVFPHTPSPHTHSPHTLFPHPHSLFKGSTTTTVTCRGMYRGRSQPNT